MTPTKFFLASLFLLSSAAHAGYLAIGESGEILPQNQYQFGFAPQLQLNEGSGGNVDAFVDFPYSDSVSFRADAGFGKIDFHGEAAVKYIPFPDVDNQPAIGGRAAAWYGRTNGENDYTLQLAPLLSRRLETDAGRFVPYVAIPVNITSSTSRNYVGTQIVGGTEWHNPDWQNLLFTGELAIDLNDSYSALTFTVAFPFDGPSRLPPRRPGRIRFARKEEAVRNVPTLKISRSNRMFSFFRRNAAAADINIDLGTANTIISGRDKGILLNEPSLVAYTQTEPGRKRVLAVGSVAREVLLRTPGNVVSQKPIRDGVIADFDLAQEMLKEFFVETAGEEGLLAPARRGVAALRSHRSREEGRRRSLPPGGRAASVFDRRADGGRDRLGPSR